MRLLNVETWKFESYPTADAAPPYAILSHRWQDDEITFEDFVEHPLSEENRKLSRRIQRLERLVLALATDNPPSGINQAESSFKSSAPPEVLLEEEPSEPPILETFPHLSRVYGRKAWPKLEGLAAIAVRLGLSHVWVDTFCIDQKSSSELSESINSMFLWYTMSRICVAYLFDVRGGSLGGGHHFSWSEWFERGWTLQELIAPQELWFFDAEWGFLATRKDSAGDIYLRTKIPVVLFTGNGVGDLHKFSVAARLSWASNRKTSRPEDRAYSLMGLFGVNISTIYGEGESKAFFRLQSEIFQAIRDQSIFCWGTFPYAIGHALPCFHPRFVAPSSPHQKRLGLFASSVQDFSECGDIELEHHNLSDYPTYGQEGGSYNAHIHRARVQLLARLYEPHFHHRRFRACLFCKRRRRSRFESDSTDPDQGKGLYIVVDIGTNGYGEFFRDSKYLWLEDVKNPHPPYSWRVTDFYIPYMNTQNQRSLESPIRWNKNPGPLWTFNIDYSALVNGGIFSVKASKRYDGCLSGQVKQLERQILYSVPYDDQLWTFEHAIYVSHLEGHPFLELILRISVTYEMITVFCKAGLYSEKSGRFQPTHTFPPTVLRLSGRYTAPMSGIFVGKAEGRLFYLLVKDQNSRPAKLILGAY